MTPMMRTCVSVALVTWIVAAPAWAGQPLEAETARIALAAGNMPVFANFRWPQTRSSNRQI